RHNLRAARASGLPYVPTIAYYFSIPWLLSQRYILPILHLLPAHFHGPWLTIITSGWGYTHGHTPFAILGTDTFIASAPGKNILYTASASLIHQITTRRIDFPKPVGLHLYQAQNLFGRNVLTVEGEEWRRHRRVVAGSFSDASNGLVFEESVRQAGMMVGSWRGRGGEAKEGLRSIMEDTLRLSLHVISRAGFGMGIEWPGVQGERGERGEVVVDVGELGRGHELSFVEAMEGVLRGLLMLLLVPVGVMARLPFKAAKEAYHTYMEWSRYLEDLYNLKHHAISSNTRTDDARGFDLMGSMILESQHTTSEKAPSTTAPETTPSTGLTKSEILGNSFIFLNAGHETSAHTIQMCILHLAIHPHIQRRLQASLDDILGSRPPSTWSYETDYPLLADTWPGAIMNESLRLCPSVVNVPKIVPPGPSQILKVDGRDHPVAEGTFVWLAVAAVGRNPKYWLSEHGERDPADLHEWRAERWMCGQLEEEDGKEGLFRPQKGALIPFSEGQRSCIGQRFAKTEIVAVLAAVFKEWSVELVVDGEREGMDEEERREKFEVARVKAVRTIMEGCKTGPTLRLREGEVPIRLVRRGEERYGDL
ncbi:cytochrome P450, partial [Elsinoe ampelina]